MKRLLPLILCFALLLSAPVHAGVEPAQDTAEALPAAPEDAALPAAVDLTAQCTVYCNGAFLPNDMLDGSYFTRGVLPAGSVIKVVCATPIGGIYARFDETGLDEYPAPWTLEVNGETRLCGEEQYMQQYVGGFSATELTLTFSETTGVSDLYFISEGSVPDWVQVWEAPLERADLLLMACHSDDDQYTFTGVIPWALSQGVQTQVVYFINHYTHPNRVHELLDGLWASGMHIYPALGHFRDEEHETTLQSYLNTGYTEEDLIGSIVADLRRFQPQIIITHDLDGEYGHGAHILYAQLILKAIEVSGDASSFPESAALYGAWDVPKVYVHAYEENPVVLDLDSPLAMFGGRTAYKVGQDAFMKEVSQTWYAGQMSWLYGQTLATEVADYRPCDYGLYRSLVGPDTHTDTLLDNIVLYAEQERLAAEEAARLAAEEEAARLAAEEEAARLAAEEEAARLAAEEEAARAAAAATATPVPSALSAASGGLDLRRLLIPLAALVAVIALVLLLVFRRRRDETEEEEDWEEEEEEPPVRPAPRRVSAQEKKEAAPRPTAARQAAPAPTDRRSRDNNEDDPRRAAPARRTSSQKTRRSKGRHEK